MLNSNNDFLFVFFFLVLSLFAGPLMAADDEPESEGVAGALGAIPPLERWNDPYAISMKDLLSSKPPMVAGNLLVEELIKSAKELTELVKTTKPDFPSYSEEMATMAKAQLKIRVLLETMKFLASMLPDAEQNALKTAAKEQFGSALTELDIALSTAGMMRASKEIAALRLDFASPYVDAEELFNTTVKEMTPQKQSSDTMDSEYSGYDDGYGSAYSGRGNLLAVSKSFLGGYKPGPVDDKKMEPLVNALVSPARTHLLGYTPRNSSSGDIMDYNVSTPAVRPGAAQSAQKSDGALNLTGELNNSSSMSSGPVREDLDESVRKSIAFALKSMLQDENTKIGSKIVAAYCAFATEDYVPEVALFLERSGNTLKEKDMEILVSFPIESDYIKDPRVNYLMTRALFSIAPGAAGQSQAREIFGTTPGTSRFLTAGLDHSREIRDLSLIMLFRVGDGDSAIPVAKLLADRSLENGFRMSLLAILGETGDQRVATTIIRCLLEPELAEGAQNALIRIGSPVEKSVLTIFSAKRPELDRIALEIISKIGSWGSLSKLGAQLSLYSEAKSQDEAARATDEKPKLILEPSEQNELIQKTIETGTTVIARMTGSVPPDIKGGAKNSSQSGMGSPSYPGSDYDSDSMMYSDSSSTRAEDKNAPRTLVKKGEMSPGNAPVNWAQGLAIAGSKKFEEITKVLSRVANYDTGVKGGMEMRSLSWAVDYFQGAGKQLKTDCIPLLEPDARKAVEGSLARIANRFEKVSLENRRIKRTNSPSEGFREGFSGGSGTP